MPYLLIKLYFLLFIKYTLFLDCRVRICRTMLKILFTLQVKLKNGLDTHLITFIL